MDKAAVQVDLQEGICAHEENQKKKEQSPD
jgi:hypothetical protein